MQVGERILKLRKENNISQEELGFKINVSRQTISKWENNETSPDLNNLKSLTCGWSSLNESFPLLRTSQASVSSPTNA